MYGSIGKGTSKGHQPFGGMLLVGPIGHLGPRHAEFEGGAGDPLDYKGFQLVARARRGPIGWVGELLILFPQIDSPVHGFVPVARFREDPNIAIQEALLEGIHRVDRGEVIEL